MRKIFGGALCALIIISIVFVFRGGKYSRTEYLLDTVIRIEADNKKAVNEAFNEIERLEKLLSAYIADSDIYAINKEGKGIVSAETAYVIDKAEEYKALTEGAFDISVKPVVDLWDVKGTGYVPDDEEIKDKLSLLGGVAVTGNEVILEKPGMQIDLGGIAKGYVGDCVKEVLVKNGVKSAIVDLGGNIVVVGNKSYKIGLQHPQQMRGTVFGKINVSDKTVVTSGGYERNFEKDGKTYHHIIDPRTGKNPENNVLSVTIIADDGILADALSTACFVKGRDEGLALAEKSGVQAVIFTTDGIYCTKDLHLEK